jgi:hypothetical protein
MATTSPGLIFRESVTEFGMVVQLVSLARTLTKWPGAFWAEELQ